MNSDRRIVLHAGLPKTGTTSIQATFYAQRSVLLDQARLLYPSHDANLTNALCTLFHDDPRKHITNKLAGLTTLEAIAPLQREYRDELESEIAATEWDTLLDDVAWMNAEFGLDLYADMSASRASGAHSDDTARSRLDERSIDDIAALISDLLTDCACLRAIESGRHAISQGDLETARNRFLEARRLDPDAPQPKAWLERLRNERGVSAT